MDRTRARRILRIWAVAGAVVALAFGASTVSAAKPTNKPVITLKVGAVVSGFDVTLNYQVNAPAAKVGAQLCTLTDPDDDTAPTACDATPNQGSGAKLTKYSVNLNLPQSGPYTFSVDVALIGGGHLAQSAAFTIVAGPAVRLSVSGLVPQGAVCYVGIDCLGWPPANYPRQIATVKALDVNGNVATSYAGTVTFTNPFNGVTPGGLVDSTLTAGVGYVPVLIPSLPLTFVGEPYTSSCPGGNVVFTAVDTLDPSIFGCQSLEGGSLNFILPDGFDEAVSAECPTGCYSEPTESITIDTRTTPLTLHNTLNINPGGSVTVAGQTTSGLYFAQVINLGDAFIVGNTIFPPIIAPCGQCTTDMNYFARTSATITTVPVNVDGSYIEVGGTYYWPWDGTSSGTNMTVTTIPVGATSPQCFSDGGYQDLVNLCN